MKPFEVGKTYNTKDGRTATILKTDARNEFGSNRLIGCVHNINSDVASSWKIDGTHDGFSGLRLIPEKEEVTFWIEFAKLSDGRLVINRCSLEPLSIYDIQGRTFYQKKITITLEE